MSETVGTPSFRVSFVGKDTWTARLGRANASALPEVSKHMEEFAVKARSDIMAALPHKSGKMAAGTTVSFKTTPTTASASFASDVRYFDIVEFGGTIASHVVRPTKQRAMQLVTKLGNEMYAGKVTIPTVEYAGKHYFANILKGMRQSFTEAVTLGVNEATKP